MSTFIIGTPACCAGLPSETRGHQRRTPNSALGSLVSLVFFSVERPLLIDLPSSHLIKLLINLPSSHLIKLIIDLPSHRRELPRRRRLHRARRARHGLRLQSPAPLPRRRRAHQLQVPRLQVRLRLRGRLLAMHEEIMPRRAPLFP